MSASELKELRKETKRYIDQADERAVRMIYAMLKSDAENEREQFELTTEQEAILNERMERYEKGEMKFSSWDDVKSRIMSKVKNDLHTGRKRNV